MRQELYITSEALAPGKHYTNARGWEIEIQMVLGDRVYFSFSNETDTSVNSSVSVKHLLFLIMDDQLKEII